MQKLKKILLIYEKNNYTGLGHYKRIYNLNLRLKKKFTTKVLEIKKAKKLNFSNFDIIIFDLLKYDNFFFKERKLFSKSLTFDNFKSHTSKVNISIFDHNKKIIGKRYEGLKFSVFSNDLEKIKKIKSKKDTYFISLGSKDTKNYLPGVTQILKNKNYNFKIGSFKKNKKFRKFYVNQKNYYKEFKNSSCCIVNAGVTLTEAIFMKKLCFVLPQDDYEKKFASFLLKKNYIIAIGLNNFENNLKKRKKVVQKKINKLLDNKADIRIINLIKKNFNFI